MRYFLAVFAVLGLAAACSSGSPAGDAGLRAELRAAQQQWQQNGTANYSYVGRWLCFCPPEYTDPVRVEVQAGQVVRVSYQNPANAQAVPDPERYRPVEGMFAYIQEAIDDNAASIDARYDESQGYPAEVFIDWDERIADEEYGFSLEALEASD